MSIGDYHVHTQFSLDGRTDMVTQCQVAIERGISEIAFTDHVDHDICDAESRERYSYEAYREEVLRNRERFGDKLNILVAAEIDWNDTIADDVSRFLDTYPFDFIIGSVHNLNHTYVGFTTVEALGGARKMYDDYLDQITGLVETGFPNVIGHLDLPRRYHHISMADVDAEHFEARIREIFRTAAARGVGFEINTSGLRKDVGVSHPEPEVLRWFLDEGGSVLTVGSDSHDPQDTGHSIRDTYRRLQELGIDWRSSFVGGEHKKVPLPTD